MKLRELRQLLAQIPADCDEQEVFVSVQGNTRPAWVITHLVLPEGIRFGSTVTVSDEAVYGCRDVPVLETIPVMLSRS